MSSLQRSDSNPTAMLASLMGKREKLRKELRNVEKQVYELETNYLQDSSHSVHFLKGFEGFLSSSKSSANLKRSRKLQPEYRLFSLSSVTSPVTEELGLGCHDTISDFGPVRSEGRSGTLPANKQEKPKKGRDVKKIRKSNEAEFDDEDDPDTNMR